MSSHRRCSTIYQLSAELNTCAVRNWIRNMSPLVSPARKKRLVAGASPGPYFFFNQKIYDWIWQFVSRCWFRLYAGTLKLDFAIQQETSDGMEPTFNTKTILYLFMLMIISVSNLRVQISISHFTKVKNRTVFLNSFSWWRTCLLLFLFVQMKCILISSWIFHLCLWHICHMHTKYKQISLREKKYMIECILHKIWGFVWQMNIRYWICIPLQYF